jgi:integrase
MHGELSKLGIEVAQSTVAKYLYRPRKPPSQTWRTFLTNHLEQAAISVQQKMMRHASIKTTMDIYGDVVTDEMSTASRKVAELVFPSNGAQAERKAS